MRLIFFYGPPASGKLTIARLVAERTGMALFHNHLVVDAVAAVFPFGSPEFIRLRERLWIETFAAAARADRSLIFTFAPEPSVAADFPERVARIVADAAGEVLFVALTLSPEILEQRLADPVRAAFGKLRSVELWREMRAGFDRCLAAMPAPTLRIDTGVTSPTAAAAAIVTAIPT